MALNGQKRAGKSPLIVRVALFVALALVIICAILWYSLKRDLDRGTALCEDNKFQEAVAVLEPLMHKPLAALRIRAVAQKSLGVCKAGLAELAAKERTADGYRKALDLLKEARQLAGATPGIENAVKEYTEYLNKLEHPETPPATPPTPPTAPAKTPPATK